MAQETKLPELNFHGHGYPNCDCDLVGGDGSCTIQPPYVDAYNQRCEQLKSVLERVKYLEKKAEEEYGDGWDDALELIASRVDKSLLYKDVPSLTGRDIRSLKRTSLGVSTE